MLTIADRSGSNLICNFAVGITPHPRDNVVAPWRPNPESSSPRRGLASAGEHRNFGSIAKRHAIAARLRLSDAHDVASPQLKEGCVGFSPVLLLEGQSDSTFGSATDVTLAPLTLERLGHNPENSSGRRLTPWLSLRREHEVAHF